MFQTLLESIESRKATVGVIGLGYVGLPLVRAFVYAGYQTIGFDVDQSKVTQLLAGKSYISHISAEWIAGCVEDGTFTPTAEMGRLAEADVILICVPTPLTADRDPDLQYVVGTTETIAENLKSGQLIVLESTTYPGTTRDVMLPILLSSGKKSGQDFFLAYSPEREDPGNANFTASQIPKVVGGIDEHSRELAVTLYGHAVEQVVPVSNCEVAEACKILENTYRSVNIAMINELKTLFARLGIDVWEVIAAAKTKPFGFQPFYPGPGLGGHCIPIDPFYLSWLARENGMETRFIELAGEVNAAMPNYVVSKVLMALNELGKPVKGAKIGILGIAYKKDVDDPRESPSFRLLELLGELKADLSYVDPHIPELPAMRSFQVPQLAAQPLTSDYLNSQDAVVISTDHTVFDYQLIADYTDLVIDTRNAMAATTPSRANIIKA
ncbi:MAG: UDP-N-acetyl-D-glucosamine dehydrogenase [Planctomycetaceae bacterium]|nr:UDP-N-acetyl-D-glucosamine dehydrogenase [Planctomycetaceae bacterium]|tara:strand:+ start:6545 stop:7864 length:1320 start_codon:yes stop_codon:yes gene_type:complete